MTVWDPMSEHWLHPDDIYDRPRDEDDQLADGLDDDAFERDAQAIWDAVNQRWIDV